MPCPARVYRTAPYLTFLPPTGNGSSSSVASRRVRVSPEAARRHAQDARTRCRRRSLVRPCVVLSSVSSSSSCTCVHESCCRPATATNHCSLPPSLSCCWLDCGVRRPHKLEPGLESFFFYKINIVALSFTFDKYYLIID